MNAIIQLVNDLDQASFRNFESIGNQSSSINDEWCCTPQQKLTVGDVNQHDLLNQLIWKTICVLLKKLQNQQYRIR